MEIIDTKPTFYADPYPGKYGLDRRPVMLATLAALVQHGEPEPLVSEFLVIVRRMHRLANLYPEQAFFRPPSTFDIGDDLSKLLQHSYGPAPDVCIHLSDGNPRSFTFRDLGPADMGRQVVLTDVGWETADEDLVHRIGIELYGERPGYEAPSFHPQRGMLDTEEPEEPEELSFERFYL